MSKRSIRNSLAGLSIAALLGGLVLSNSGCTKAEGSCGQAPKDTGMTEGSQSSCGQGSCGSQPADTGEGQ